MSKILVWKTADCSHLMQSTIVPFSPDAPLPQVHWRERDDVEHDPDWQQPIPYGVLLSREGTVFSYRRSGGDSRLQARHSIGLGGHIEQQDQVQNAEILEATQAIFSAGLGRELNEELNGITQEMINEARPIAWIHEHESAIGLTHLGLLFVLHWPFPAPPAPNPNEPLVSLGFRGRRELLHDNSLEIWSRLALAALEKHL